VVYVDFDPDLWQVGSRKQSREGPGLEMIKQEYELEQISEYFYRIAKRKKPPASSNESNHYPR
jgi:hypothetical protein